MADTHTLGRLDTVILLCGYWLVNLKRKGPFQLKGSQERGYHKDDKPG